MIYESDNILKMLWWNFLPGYTIKMQWPIGWTTPDHLGNQFYSNDPEDHWGRWLKDNVGKKGWDWDWKLSHNMQDIDIRFRKKEGMILFSLQWL